MPVITPEQEEAFWRHLGNGCSVLEASRRAKINESTGYRLVKKVNTNGKTARAARGQRATQRPIPIDALSDEALRALSDFAYFQRRIFGCIPIYWQDKAAEKILELLESPEREFADINCPPGAGKTYLFMCMLPAWLTCRRRSIRGLMGSGTIGQVQKSTDLLRKELARVRPIEQRPEDIAAGFALDAETTMSHDYGRFKPVEDLIWTRTAFTVMQHEGGDLAEKDYTWQGVSRENEFIGGRYDIAIWDDIQDIKRLRQEEMIEADRSWWDMVAETRLEPSGLLVLQGQRLGAVDLHRYNLDKVDYDDEEDDEDEEGEVVQLAAIRTDGTEELPRKYHHIVFKAHYDELCQGKPGHRRNSPAYGEGGCCLYPARLSWRDLRRVQRNNEEQFEVEYQQKDTDPEHVLVRSDWVSGSGGHPGCWDMDRDRCEIPKNLEGPLISVMSVDPSASKYWGIEWWIYHPASEQRFLIDAERRKMDAPGFLDWDQNQGGFTGLLEEWWQSSKHLGVPITYVIVESNACQRHLLQYNHTHRWIAARGVEVIPHVTHLNKSNPDFGVQTLAPHWRFGRVRLPGKPGGDGRLAALKLVGEVTRYPKSGTTDMVMAEWFFEYQLQMGNLYAPEAPGSAGETEWRPSWMKAKPA